MSLLELTMAMVIGGIGFGVVTSAVMIMSKSAQLETAGPSVQTAGAARISEHLTADLRLALVFKEREANLVEFTVPDRDNDGLPELIRYEWTGAPGNQLTRLVDLSDAPLEATPVVIAEDVAEFDLTYMLRTWGDPPPPPALVSEEVLILAHDEKIDLTANRALLVVTSSGGPTSQEQARVSLLESWGYTVTLISASALQSTFNTAIATTDVAYISEEINSGDLGTKLRSADIGVVNEEINLVDEFGLAGQFGFPTSELSLHINATAHHITSGFTPGSVPMFDTFQAITNIDADPAFQSPHLEILGNWSGAPSLAVLEWADRLYDPGGLVTTKVVLLVVRNDASLDGGESTRRTMLESWGYDVTLISDHASQSSFDVAVAAADAVYVCAGVVADDVGSKLTDATIGIVSEPVELADELGLKGNDGDTTTSKKIDVIDNTHFITAPLDTGEQNICDNDQPLSKYTGDIGIARVLAEGSSATSPPGMALLETGDPLEGIEGTAAGRRVFMPWGGPDFNIDKLKDGGPILMRRAVEWAIGFGVAGFDTAFATHTPTDFDKKHVATQVTVPSDAKVTAISVYLFLDGDHDMRLGLYTDAEGEPGQLLGQTDKEKPDFDGSYWYTAQLPTPVTVPAGTYWLAIGMHKDAGYHYEPSGGQTRHADSGSDPKEGLMTSWSGTYESNTRRISVYAQYEDVELAAGRRVELPWAGNAFDIDSLTSQGADLLRRSLQWAADTPDPTMHAPVGDTTFVAQYILPSLPENTLEWSITQIFVRLRADNPIDGKVRFKLQHADGNLKPSAEIIVESAPIPEATFDPSRFLWYEVPLPPINDLNPDYGVCLVVEGDRERSAILAFDQAGAEPTPGTHYMVSIDDGDTWSDPNSTDDLRIHVYGTYSTIGEPQWP